MSCADRSLMDWRAAEINDAEERRARPGVECSLEYFRGRSFGGYGHQQIAPPVVFDERFGAAVIGLQSGRRWPSDGRLCVDKAAPA